MDSTKSHVTVYNISPEMAEDFQFDFDTEGVEKGSSDILTELVPDLDSWGEVGWIEVEDYEYSSSDNTISLTLNTKWKPPSRWLQQASYNNIYFENKLITMATIQRDETCVTGVAIMDGELLQNKEIFNMPLKEVEKYYNDDEFDYELDDLDNQIWDSIEQFINVCKKFYLEEEK